MSAFGIRGTRGGRSRWEEDAANFAAGGPRAAVLLPKDGFHRRFSVSERVASRTASEAKLFVVAWAVSLYSCRRSTACRPNGFATSRDQPA